MRNWLMFAGLVGLGGCVLFDPPMPAPYADSGWRTRAGAPLSSAEIAALQHSCTAPPITLALDPDRPVANPVNDHPVYRPGGEGLANAPALGIAAPDRPFEPGTRRVAGLRGSPLDECLARRGLIRVR